MNGPPTGRSTLQPGTKRVRLSKPQVRMLVLLAVITPLGFYTKFYRGPAQEWVSNSLGGFFYVVFWCLFFFVLSPGVRPWVIALTVLLITCLLEFSQLWHPPFLEAIRSHFLGRALIGNEFQWSDFLYYLVGSLAGWALGVWRD